MTVTDRIDHFFGPVLAACPSPMPEGAMREIIRHESAGLPERVVADEVDGGSELGGNQLYVQHRPDATPVLSSHDGAIGADVDPLDPLGSVFGAQWVYQKAKIGFAQDIAARKLIVPSDADVGAWIAIMQVQHSLGAGAFRRLMTLGAARALKHPIVILWHFAQTEMPPKIGRMTPKLVRRRIFDLLDLPSQAAKVKPLPATILPLGSRPAAVPVFDAHRARRYVLAERKRVAEGRSYDPQTGSPL